VKKYPQELAVIFNHHLLFLRPFLSYQSISILKNGGLDKRFIIVYAFYNSDN